MKDYHDTPLEIRLTTSCRYSTAYSSFKLEGES